MRRLFSRSRFSGGGGLGTAALAPMVDLLTIILVAVLRTWSTDPPLVFTEKGLELPMSQREAPTGAGIQVEVGQNGLYVQGWRTGSAKYWTDSEDVLIQEVYDALQALAGQKVVVRAHTDAPWGLVGKVMFTAQQAGYSQVELVAVSRASL